MLLLVTYCIKPLTIKINIFLKMIEKIFYIINNKLPLGVGNDFFDDLFYLGISILIFNIFKLNINKNLFSNILTPCQF